MRYIASENCSLFSCPVWLISQSCLKRVRGSDKGTKEGGRGGGGEGARGERGGGGEGGESEQLKGREPEWSNPQIEDRKLPDMPKNQVKLAHSMKTKL